MPSRAILAPSPAPVTLGHHDTTTPTFPPLAAGVSFSIFITLSFCFCKFSRKRSSPATVNTSSAQPREFSYSTLRRATGGFSPKNRLGQGGFGVVFRGILSAGENVAVKVMDSGSLQGESEFQNELFFAGKLDSPHVVPVIGISADRKRRRLLLVYKLMDNGNLQDALLRRKCPELMDWNRRFSVAVDIAEGIEHLHGLEPPVIHGDIKPSNVLLDHLLVAKIADFGLARLKPDKVEITVSPERDGGSRGAEAEDSESVITTVTKFEDFDFGLVDQSPESVVKVPDSVTVSPEVDGVEREKGGGRKWKQESNVDTRNGKEYVMQWIGSEVKRETPSRGDWIEALAATASSSSSPSKKLEKNKRLEWWLSLEEENENKKMKRRRRMVREWWKDEYRKDLAKNKKKKKPEESEICSDDGSSSSSVSQWPRASTIERWLGNSHDSVSGISSTPSMRGTVFYAAPEYCNIDNANDNVSEKCDVYSYGVLLLVLVSGRRPLEMTGSAREIKRANLMYWARKLARRGRLVDLVDRKLQNLNQEQAVLCIKVALLCLQRSPVSRPSMKEVLGMLRGEVSLPELPTEFSLSPPSKTERKHRR